MIHACQVCPALREGLCCGLGCASAWPSLFDSLLPTPPFPRKPFSRQRLFGLLLPRTPAPVSSRESTEVYLQFMTKHTEPTPSMSGLQDREYRPDREPDLQEHQRGLYTRPDGPPPTPRPHEQEIRHRDLEPHHRATPPQVQAELRAERQRRREREAALPQLSDILPAIPPPIAVGTPGRLQAGQSHLGRTQNCYPMTVGGVRVSTTSREQLEREQRRRERALAAIRARAFPGCALEEPGTPSKKRERLCRIGGEVCATELAGAGAGVSAAGRKSGRGCPGRRQPLSRPTDQVRGGRASWPERRAVVDSRAGGETETATRRERQTSGDAGAKAPRSAQRPPGGLDISAVGE